MNRSQRTVGSYFGLGLVIAVCWLILSCANQTEPSEGSTVKSRLADLVLPLVSDHDTKYAAKYDEGAFRELGVGVSQSEVKALLGPPLSERCFSGGRTYWYYSEAGVESDNYHTRIVGFDEAGLVVEKHRTFYLD